MNLDVKHNTIERDVKDQIRKQHHLHHTEVDDYTFQDGVEYQNTVTELGKNILTYLIKFEPDKVRNWVSTKTFDFDE